MNSIKDLIQETEKEIKELYFEDGKCMFNDNDTSQWKSPDYERLRERLNALKQCQTIAEEREKKIIEMINNLPTKDITPRDDDYGLYTEVLDSEYGGFVKIEDLELLKQQLNPAQTKE